MGVPCSVDRTETEQRDRKLDTRVAEEMVSNVICKGGGKLAPAGEDQEPKPKT